MKSKFLLLAFLVSIPVIVSAQKTTATNTRLIGACFRISASSSLVYINDSDVYTYSGYNGGAQKNSGTAIANNWTYSGKYDQLVRRRYDTAASHPPHYYLRDQTTNHYTGTNNNLDTSTYQTYDTLAAVYKNYSRVINTFDGSNNLTTALTQYWVSSAWKDSTEHWYTYDGSNNLIADTSKNLGNAGQSRLYLYHYNGSNALDTMTQMNWSTTSSSFILANNVPRTVYFLNSSSKPDSTTTYSWSTTSMAWNANSKIRYIYSGSTVTTDTTRNLFGGTWYLGTVDLYTYNAGGDMITDTVWQNFGSFRPYNIYVNTYDGSHNETYSEKYTWLTSSSTWRDTAKVTNTYNSDNHLTSYMTQTMVGGSWIMTRIGGGGGYSDVLNNYYYETYNDHVGVPNLNTKNGSLRLYPVPTNNMLNIEISWDNAQTAVFAIYDMTGRLWMQWQSDNTANYKHTVYTSQLPAGNYILKVRGENGQAAQPFIIVR